MSIFKKKTRKIEVSLTPYRHFVINNLLDETFTRKVVDWFDQQAEWKTQKSRFFNQFSCENLDITMPEEQRLLIDPANIQYLRKLVEKTFSVELSETRITYCAHKFVKGLGVGIHTDKPEDGSETHRFIIHFNREFNDDHGGHLILLSENNSDYISKIVRPVNNVAFCFELSDHSFHAVSDVEKGTRYTVIYSFWKKGLGPEVEKEKGNMNIQQDYLLYINFLKKLNADKTPHTYRSVLDHLIGTAQTLRKWNADNDVCLGGLFHNAYGTDSFDKCLLSIHQRDQLIALIGERAEKFVYIFCFLNRKEFYDKILDGQKTFFVDLNKPDEKIFLNEADIMGILLILWANFMDQGYYLPLSDEELDTTNSLLDLMKNILPGKCYKYLYNKYSINRSFYKQLKQKL